MKRHAVFIMALLAWLIAAPASAQTFPALSGRVVDAANLLDPAQEAALDAKLKGLEDQSDRQMVVATVPDLQGYPIEDYGYRLGRAWGLGQADKDNGALLIVAPAERKVRIEVGYGLEPILTDAYSSVIINSVIVPRFKGGDYPGGIAAGTDAMIAQLMLPPGEAVKRAAVKPDEGGDGSAVIFWLFIFFFFILPILWPLFFPGKRGRRLGAPIIIWGGSSGGSNWGGGGSSGGFGGGFSGGGGSFGGGGASGGW
jgi:uncharacterized protein